MYQENELEISKTPHGTHDKRNIDTLTFSVILEETSTSAKTQLLWIPRETVSAVCLCGFCFVLFCF